MKKIKNLSRIVLFNVLTYFVVLANFWEQADCLFLIGDFEHPALKKKNQ
jgi:hypothetical protein